MASDSKWLQPFQMQQDWKLHTVILILVVLQPPTTVLPIMTLTACSGLRGLVNLVK